MCDYCENGKDILSNENKTLSIFLDPNGFIGYRRKNTKYNLEDLNFMEIYYCPMCGKSMEQKET